MQTPKSRDEGGVVLLGKNESGQRHGGRKKKNCEQLMPSTAPSNPKPGENENVSLAQSCLTLCNPMDCSLLGSSVHGIVQERIPGVGSHSLLQGIFPTLGLSPGLLPCRQILYHLSHQGSHRKGTDSLLLLSDPNCILPSSLHF